MSRIHPSKPHRLTDESLKDLIATGNRITDDVERLEKLIWLVRAEAYAQLNDATKAYTKDFEANGILSDAAQKVNEISEYCLQLAKLWEQARQLRNRGVKFNELDHQPDFAKALATVFENRQDRR